jgi:hypothetical protein
MEEFLQRAPLESAYLNVEKIRAALQKYALQHYLRRERFRWSITKAVFVNCHAGVLCITASVGSAAGWSIARQCLETVMQDWYGSRLVGSWAMLMGLS